MPDLSYLSHEKSSASGTTIRNTPYPLIMRRDTRHSVSNRTRLLQENLSIRRHLSKRSQPLPLFVQSNWPGRRGLPISIDVCETPGVAENRQTLAALAALAASTCSEIATGSILRRSSLIRMEQNRGPHMEQNSALLNTSCGSVSSCIERAVSGSSDNANCLLPNRRYTARETEHHLDHGHLFDGRATSAA